MESADGLDSLLVQIGTGRWNYLMFFTSSLVPALLTVYLIGSEFMNPVPEFTCDVPVDNYTLPVNGSQCLIMEGHQQDYEITPCKNWLYDKSVFHSTVSMEWNLVCDRAWLSPLFQTIFTIGGLFGNILGGAVANRYGRRLALRAGSILTIVTTVLMLFAPWISLILTARFFLGTFTAMMLCPAFILAMEVCKPCLRTTVGVLVALPYALNMIALPSIAYLIPDWRWIQVLGAYPVLLLLPFSLCIDESPRWLVVTGRVDEAVKVFQRAVRLNKSKLPDDMDLHAFITKIHKRLMNGNPGMVSNEECLGEDNIQEATACGNCGASPAGSEDQVDCTCPRRNSLGPDDGFGSWWAGPVALFRTSVMRKIMLVLLVMRLIQGIVYIGIPLNSGAFSSPFLYIALLGLVELPAYSLTAPITKKLGRKKVAIPSLIGAGALLLLSLAIEEAGIHLEWLHMVFVLASYLLICIAYVVNVLYAPELLPTTLRPWGTTAAVFFANIGFCIAPYITDNPNLGASWLPLAVFGSGGIIAGSLIFLLPETNGRDLPETVGDLRDRLERERSQKKDRASDPLLNTKRKTTYDSI